MLGDHISEVYNTRTPLGRGMPVWPYCNINKRAQATTPRDRWRLPIFQFCAWDLADVLYMVCPSPLHLHITLTPRPAHPDQFEQQFTGPRSTHSMVFLRTLLCLFRRVQVSGILKHSKHWYIEGGTSNDPELPTSWAGRETQHQVFRRGTIFEAHASRQDACDRSSERIRRVTGHVQCLACPRMADTELLCNI